MIGHGYRRAGACSACIIGPSLPDMVSARVSSAKRLIYHHTVTALDRIWLSFHHMQQQCGFRIASDHVVLTDEDRLRFGLHRCEIVRPSAAERLLNDRCSFDASRLAQRWRCQRGVMEAGIAVHRYGLKVQRLCFQRRTKRFECSLTQTAHCGLWPPMSVGS